MSKGRVRKKKPPFKRVAFHWVDAYSVDAWTPVVDLQAMIDKPAEHPDYATGYVVAENEDWIMVSPSLSYDAEAGRWLAAATMAIRKGMVVEPVLEEGIVVTGGE